jgi:hypothetical protein
MVNKAIKDGYRPHLFDVDIESFSDMKYQIADIEYCGFTDSRSLELTLGILETEDFYVRGAFDKMIGKILTFRAYKKNGDIAYFERRKITHLTYEGLFSWELDNQIFKWTVGVTVGDKLED